MTDKDKSKTKNKGYGEDEDDSDEDARLSAEERREAAAARRAERAEQMSAERMSRETQAEVQREVERALREAQREIERAQRRLSATLAGRRTENRREVREGRGRDRVKAKVRQRVYGKRSKKFRKRYPEGESFDVEVRNDSRLDNRNDVHGQQARAPSDEANKLGSIPTAGLHYFHRRAFFRRHRRRVN